MTLISLHAESHFFFITLVILAPASVARNQPALDNRLRQAAPSCTLPHLLAPICRETEARTRLFEVVSHEAYIARDAWPVSLATMDVAAKLLLKVVFW
jgi:hypothetical protein